MSAPSLSVAVEPFESGAVVYAPLAAPAAGEDESGRLMLRLEITNDGNAAVTMQDLTVKLSGPGSYPSGVVSFSALGIGAHATAIWCFPQPSDDVIFPVAPPPTTIELRLSCSGFSDPATFQFPLAPHASPTPQGSYLFPAHTSDLRPAEYWRGNGGTHGVGSEGSQSFAYDLGVIGFDDVEGWQWTLPTTDGTHNEDLRIWDKPVCAMADGTVNHVLFDVPSNPHPLTWSSDAELQQKLDEQKANYWGAYEADHGGAGNHLYLQHGDEIVLYAHMQPDTIPQALRTKGATVHAGDFLGLAGNSGNSTSPHLHVHAIQGTEAEVGPLRPLVFRSMAVIAADELPFPGSGPWVDVVGRSLPPVDTDIWPGLRLHLPHVNELAIDPLALILRDDVYVKLTLPDPAPIERARAQLRRELRTLGPAGRRELLHRLETLRDYAATLANDVRAARR